jgi:O-antigen/teichoic acid export membrane protein
MLTKGAHRRAGDIPSVGQTSATSVAIVALGAVAGVVAARVLGPHSRGVYAIATVAPTFIGIAGTLGVEEAIVYLAARSEGHRTTGHLIWGSFVLASALGLIASAASIAFQLLLFWTPALGVSEVLFISIACQPLLFALAQVSLAHLRAQARYTAWNVLRILVSFVYLGGMVIVIAVGTLTVNAAILCLLAASVAVLIGSVVPICFVHRPSTSRAEIERMLSYGWKNHLITVQTYANQQLDQVFLAAMVPAAQLGQYAIAVTYASAGLSLGVAPALQMYSHFSRQKAPDPAAYRHLVTRTLLLLGGICLVTGLLAPFFIPLVFGKSYKMAVAPALILILSSPLLSLSAMSSAIWKSAGKPLIAAKAQGIGLIVTVVTLPAAITYFGIDGAAIVSIVVYGIVAAWLWHSSPFDGLLESRRSSENQRTYNQRIPT